MKLYPFAVLSASILLCNQAYSHSLMFDDYYFFDESDGGQGLSETEVFEIKQKKIASFMHQWKCCWIPL